jgi:hypothetical protein
MESRTIRYGVTAFTTLLLTFSGSACSKEPEAPALAHDPGVRNDGDPGAGTPYPGLPDPFQKLFNAGQDEFAKPDQVGRGWAWTENEPGPLRGLSFKSCLRWLEPGNQSAIFVF